MVIPPVDVSMLVATGIELLYDFSGLAGHLLDHRRLRTMKNEQAGC